MENNKRYIIPVNPKGLDSIAETLLQDPPTGGGGGQPEGNFPEGTLPYGDLSSYIILEGKSHGNYSYPTLFISTHRLAADQPVLKAAQGLQLNLQNSAKEQSGYDYIGNINWFNALKLNLSLGNITLNPREFLDFKELLEAGIGGKPVFDGKKNRVNSSKLSEVYNEIFEVRDPWRSEWLDADFKVADVSMIGKIANFVGDKVGQLYVNYDHRLIKGELKPQKVELLEACVMEDTWIDPTSFNRQGLPTRKLDAHKLYYWYPRRDNNSVAWFGANSDGAVLDCLRGPSYTGGALGVRAARVAPKNL